MSEAGAATIPLSVIAGPAPGISGETPVPSHAVWLSWIVGQAAGDAIAATAQWPAAARV